MTASNNIIEVNAPNGFAQDIALTTSAVSYTGSFAPNTDFNDIVPMGDKFYAFGGKDTGGTYLDLVMVFDTLTGTVS